ncbi:hypothetical protein BJ508DRAFT_364942 [Ascobolus immersus RN42]|uniref:Galactose oxidase n=1 Tax=Ascobolus immersus RN42 TaxID=1160509 RepID=A0A3N4HS03_ASCIM|nr:hypothetical protein BJ508DRAFT_364942 [Ascobolus immersus RN42]
MPSPIHSSKAEFSGPTIARTEARLLDMVDDFQLQMCRCTTIARRIRSISSIPIRRLTPVVMQRELEGEDGVLRAEHGAGVAAPEQNLGFYVGGSAWNETDNTMLKSSKVHSWNRMLIYDFGRNEFKSKELLNKDVGRAGASTVYVKDIGKNGILVLLGGYEIPQSTDSGVLKQGKMVGYDELEIHDTKSETWSKQMIVGEIPPSRIDGPPMNKTSHNIFKTGGMTGVILGSKPTSETHILSLPSLNLFEPMAFAEPIVDIDIGSELDLDLVILKYEVADALDIRFTTTSAPIHGAQSK